jgi:ATP synthase protein I
MLDSPQSRPPESPAPEYPAENKLHASDENMVRSVEVRQSRMLRARATGDHAYWRALSLLGVVGWSVTFPTLAGVALGIWIDRVWPSRISWTLTLLFIGLATGCMNAWTHIKNDPRE